MFETYIQQQMPSDVFENADWKHSYAVALECMRVCVALLKNSEQRRIPSVLPIFHIKNGS